MEDLKMSNTESKIVEMNFSELLKDHNKILIPKIQRDYAQGRTDDKSTEVRTRFLDGILSEKIKKIDLIFGTKDSKDNLIPIDGQQRLTTLFLLCLYDNKVNKKQYENLDKFTYETRRAAHDFCKAIVDKENEWSINNNKISEEIKNAKWFMYYWQFDPTVASMLNMLDSIQEKTENGAKIPNIDDIKFNFYDMDESGLDENLYLKMNSRGKPLTSFENLKAGIDDFLSKKIIYDTYGFDDESNNDKKISGKDFTEKWKYHIDRDWADLFWNSEKPEESDKDFAQFLCRFLLGQWILKKGNIKDDNVVESLSVEIENANQFISFEPIKTVLDEDPKVLNKLAKTLCELSSKKIIENTKSNWGDTIEKFKGFKYLAIIQSYLISDNRDWMSFCWNMAENIVTDVVSYKALCNRIKECQNNADTIYEFLSTHNFTNSSTQLQEEIEKAKKIIDKTQTDCLRIYDGDIAEYQGKTWKDIIKIAENYAFFHGAIRFMFTKEEIGDDWNDFDKKWQNIIGTENNEGLIPEDENRETVKLMFSYLSEDDIKDMFKYNKHSLSSKNDNLRTLLLDSSYHAQIHNCLMKIKSKECDSSIHKDLCVLYKDNCDRYISNQIDNMVVLSKFKNSYCSSSIDSSIIIGDNKL